MNRLLRCVLLLVSLFLPACSGDRDKDINKGKDRPVPAPPPQPAENK